MHLLVTESAVLEPRAAQIVEGRPDRPQCRVSRGIGHRHVGMALHAHEAHLMAGEHARIGRAVGLCGERVAAAAAEVEKLKTSLDVEFLQFGEAEYLKLREEFHAAAKELRRVYSRLAPWPALSWGRGTGP